MPIGHTHRHAFAHFNALDREGLALVSRRNALKAGLAGIAGLTLPDLLRMQARATEPAKTGRSEAATTVRLAREIPNIVAVKEASGNLMLAAEIFPNLSRKERRLKALIPLVLIICELMYQKNN